MEKVESTKSAGKRERLRVLVADDDELAVGEALGALTVPVPASEGKGVRGESKTDPTIEFDVVICRRGEEAIRTIRDAASGNHPIAVAFLDYHMPPGISGLTAAEEIRVHDTEVEIVIVGAPEELAA
ncbi:MAG: response regulator, partial [Deltaproteobacteria bacterium]|nr:response regulator [Deltaproteobacteria bacterium]